MPQSLAEEELVTSRKGKWSIAGVPHKGWVCVDIEDLGEPQIHCQMCESTLIRYVHHMQHPNYSDILEVGCVCAGHMEEDLIAARGREASMKNRANKRKKWITRTWKISAKGNPTINVEMGGLQPLPALITLTFNIAEKIIQPLSKLNLLLLTT